jgi:hypothetical protein
MKRAARFLTVLLVAGCSTQHPALNPSPDSSAVIYAIPQSQAFAIARGAIQSAAQRCGADTVHIDKISRGDGLRGYEADYGGSFYHFFILRNLYVIPTAGTGASGRQIDGFRFEITYYGSLGWRSGYMPIQARLPGGGCERTLISALLAGLEATGTATSVTSLETRPYGAGRDRNWFSTSH